MNENLDKIDIYNNSAIILNNKTPKKIISWITILVILLIIFIAFSFFPFNIYKPFVGYVSIDDSKSYLVLKYSDFPFSKNDKLYIKNKIYKYKIINIAEDEVILEVNLDDNLKIDRNIISVNMLKDRTTLFKIIINKLKKGLGLWKN